MRALLLAPLVAANPALDLYKKWTHQYMLDAEDAEKAAAMYAKMSAEAIPHVRAEAESLGNAEMDRIHVKSWASAAWNLERKLEDDRPAKAGAAAAKAMAPYKKAEAAYAASQAAYDTTSQLLMLRANGDTGLSKKIMMHANQYALEGKPEEAADFKLQAETLNKQSLGFADLAKSYTIMAKKIAGAIPSIQKNAGKAAVFAAYPENPTGELPAKDLFPFTVVPPLSFLQNGASTSPTATPQADQAHDGRAPLRSLRH